MVARQIVLRAAATYIQKDKDNKPLPENILLPNVLCYPKTDSPTLTPLKDCRNCKSFGGIVDGWFVNCKKEDAHDVRQEAHSPG